MEASLSEKEKEIWNYLKNLSYFTYETINTEYSLSVKIKDVFYGGRLDALVKKDNIYYILDYKTGAIPKNATYDYQTMIYMLAVKTFFKTENITFVYLDLKNKKEETIKLTSELVLEYENKLSEITGKIKQKDFYPNSKMCPCEYNIICYH